MLIGPSSSMEGWKGRATMYNHHVRLRDGLRVRAVGAVVRWSHVQATTKVRHVQRPYPWLQPLPIVSLRMSHWPPTPCRVDRRLTLCSRRHHTSNITSRVGRRVPVCDCQHGSQVCCIRTMDTTGSSQVHPAYTYAQ